MHGTRPAGRRREARPGAATTAASSRVDPGTAGRSSAGSRAAGPAARSAFPPPLLAGHQFGRGGDGSAVELVGADRSDGTGGVILFLNAVTDHDQLFQHGGTEFQCHVYDRVRLYDDLLGLIAHEGKHKGRVRLDRDPVISVDIRGGACCSAFDQHGHPWQRLPVGGIRDFAGHIAALGKSRHPAHNEQRQDQEHS